jgi:hypothetical protein
MIKNIQSQIIKKEQELKILKDKLEKESIKDNILFVKELNLEVEINVTHKNESFNQIMNSNDIKEKIKKGWRLISLCNKNNVNELAFLENNETYRKILKLDSSSTKDDFFVEQIFKRNKEQNYISRFYSYSVRHDLDFSGDANGSLDYLGVRLCRERRKNA